MRIHQLVLPLDYKEADIRQAVALKLDCDEKDFGEIEIIRRSIDARPQRGAPVFVLSIEIEIDASKMKQGAPLEDVRSVEYVFPTACISSPARPRPVIVGAGPAGLMASLALAEAGLAPILIERGAPVEKRAEHVRCFWEKGMLNPESNVLFGEGGAGLFSDGKLTARNKDRQRVRHVLKTLVRLGAPDTILVDAEPHLGSDMLLRIVPAIRQCIERSGGEVHFNARLEGIVIEKGSVRGLQINKDVLETTACILATGHSARDVYTMLSKEQVPMAPKPFAVGVRLELSQKSIDKALFGRYAGHPRIGVAAFRLTRKEESPLRACYTFCMCPGGQVIPCASSHGLVTTNGMSLSDRAGDYGNAAFLVPVTPADFPASAHSESPELAGIEFQMRIERAAFKAGGSDFRLPAASLTDFVSGKRTETLPSKLSCKRARPSDLRCILPDFVCDTLCSAIPKMLRLLNGVRIGDALLFAPETRSSSPVRILRNNTRESVGLHGLFPAGEGSGYAGGIVSSAIDGLRAAEALIQTHYKG
ncbi:MAG: NAD(P)/FAD-dependent oxidoreductase [bacterium]